MKRYEEYKASELEWLKAVPEHWNAINIRAITKPVVEKNRPDLPLLSVYRDYGVILKDSRDDNHNRAGDDLGQYKVVKPGRLVLNKMKTWQGSLGVSEYTGIVSPAYIVCDLDQTHNPRFLHFLLRSHPYIHVYNKLSYGVRVDQWDMRYEDFKQLPLYLPPREEQDIIVKFLDQKLADIDRFIANKERLIALLKEQKAAIINRAVTKGIDQDMPMKPSGIEWLGEIPAHWRMTKLSRLCSSIRDGTHAPPPAVPGLHRLLSARNIVEGKFVLRDDDRTMAPSDFSLLERSYTVRQGDIVMAVVGATTGKSAIVDNIQNASVQRSIAILRPDPRYLLNKYLNYWLMSAFIQNHIQRIMEKYSAQPGIYLEDVAALKIPSLSIAEQMLITSSIDIETDLVDSAINKAEREIELIKEFRTTLISDVVTGKIDVRTAIREETPV